MGLEPDAVEHEDVEVAEAVHRIGRDGLEVCGVGEVVEAVRDDGEFAVDNLERRHLDLTDAKWRIVNDRVRDQLRQSSAEMRRLEDVLEDAPEVDPRDLVREDRHRAVTEIQRPNIIKPEDVIDVAVRDQNRIELANISPKRLLAKIAGCIDEDRLARVLDQDRNPKPLVARVVRHARLTIASDRRHAGGGSCT